MASNGTHLSSCSCSLDLIQLGTLTLAVGWWPGLCSGLYLHHADRHRKGKVTRDGSYPLPHSAELRYRASCSLEAGGEELRALSALFNIGYSVYGRRDTWDLHLQGWLLVCNTKVPARQHFHPRLYILYIFIWEKNGYMQKGLDVGQRSCSSLSECTTGFNDSTGTKFRSLGLQTYLKIQTPEA